MVEGHGIIKVQPICQETVLREAQTCVWKHGGCKIIVPSLWSCRCSNRLFSTITEAVNKVDWDTVWWIWELLDHLHGSSCYQMWINSNCFPILCKWFHVTAAFYIFTSLH